MFLVLFLNRNPKEFWLYWVGRPAARCRPTWLKQYRPAKQAMQEFQLLLALQELIIHEVVPYLSLRDISKLDIAVTNRLLRSRCRASSSNWSEILQVCEPGNAKSSRLFSELYFSESSNDMVVCEWALGRNVYFDKLRLIIGNAVSRSLLNNHLSNHSHLHTLVLSPGYNHDLSEFENMISDVTSSFVTTVEMNNMSLSLVTQIFANFNSLTNISVVGHLSCGLLQDFVTQGGGPVASVRSLKFHRVDLHEGQWVSALFPNLTCLDGKCIQCDSWTNVLSHYTELQTFSRSTLYSTRSPQTYDETVMALIPCCSSIQVLILEDPCCKSTQLSIDLLANHFHCLLQLSVEASLDMLWLQQLSHGCPSLQLLHVFMDCAKLITGEICVDDHHLPISFPHVKDLSVRGNLSNFSLQQIVSSAPNLLELSIDWKESYDNIMTSIRTLCPRLQSIKTTNAWHDGVFVELFHPKNTLRCLHYCSKQPVSDRDLDAMSLHGRQLQVMRLNLCSSAMDQWLHSLLKCDQLHTIELKTQQYGDPKTTQSLQGYRAQRPWVNVKFSVYF